MEERIAKVVNTFIGREDHGILTGNLTLDYGGAGQATPSYFWDNATEDRSTRVGLATGANYIAGVIEACGVHSWEDVKGRTIIALIDDGLVVGIKPLPTERGCTFMFNDAIDRSS